MGTNFYLKGKPACEHCGRPAERGLHIGKSSGGWTFGLRVYPNTPGTWAEEELHRLGVDGIRSLEDWMPLFAKYGVVDEYGNDWTVADLLKNVTERSHPAGLNRRHELARMGNYDVQMPPGVTYDLIDGEFS